MFKVLIHSMPFCKIPHREVKPMTQKDFIENIFFVTEAIIKPIEISKKYNMPEASVRRVIRDLYREGKLEQKIIKQNESIYRWKNESL